jgi:hypothetical protein
MSLLCKTLTSIILKLLQDLVEASVDTGGGGGGVTGGS